MQRLNDRSEATSLRRRDQPTEPHAGRVGSFSWIATGINRIEATSTDSTVMAGYARIIPPGGSSTVLGAVCWPTWPTSGTGIYNSASTLLGEANTISGDGTLIGGHGSTATQDSTGAFPIRQPFLFDTTRGTLTRLPSVGGLHGNSVPEPTTLAAVGAASLLIARRRRQA